jgi:hypothetical protein
VSRSDQVGSDASMQPGSAIRRVRPSGPRIFSLCFIVLFGAGAIWSAATPLLAAPDEPSQIVKAVSVAHGVWSARCYVITPAPGGNPCPIGPTESTTSALGFEGLPTFYDLVWAPDKAQPFHSQTCFHSKSDGIGAIPASCARSLNRSPDASDIKGGYDKYAASYQARYPPLYYAIVGLPSHAGGSTIDLYLMRLVSVALSALFVALALTAAVVYSRNRWLIAALAIAATPMVFFLGAVVNPSGLETTAAVALWTSGVILVTERLDTPPRGLVAIVGVSAAVLASVRPLSTFWLALIVLTLVACAQHRFLGRALTTRSLQITIGLVLVVAAAAVWWVVALHSTDLYLAGNAPVPKSVPTSTIFATVLRHNSYYLPDMIGIFGWFDTYSPLFTFVVWYCLIGAMVIGASLAYRRRGVLLGLMGVIVLVLPAVIVTSHAHLNGYTWSGRDILPFAVGLPIVAAASLGAGAARRVPAVVARWAMPTVVVFAGAAQFAAFYEALRRYAVGTHGPVFGFLAHPSWQPAITVIGALVLEIAALAALSWLYLWTSGLVAAVGAEPAQAIAESSRADDPTADASSVSAANRIEGAGQWRT